MFGDPYTHCTENLAQLRGYVNTYGPGMVIWSGFVECPEAGLTTDPDILLAADVPARGRMDLSMLEGRPAACRTTMVWHALGDPFMRTNGERALF